MRHVLVELPTMQNEMMINTARCIMHEECHITVCELTKQLHISVGSAHSLLWDDADDVCVLPMDSPFSNTRSNGASSGCLSQTSGAF